MTADEIKNLYVEKLTAYEQAKNEYDNTRRIIGALIAKKRDFHRNDYVSYISAITDDGMIYYGVAANDSDCTGDGTIHISEITS